MDKIFRVFISSTFSDLKPQRELAIQAVYEKGHVPVALERRAAATDTNEDIIFSDMTDCQLYILIIGHRYGELVPGKNISFTEHEYNLALDHGLYILPLIMYKDERAEKRRGLKKENVTDNREINNEKLFDNFLERITHHFASYWESTSDDFKYKVGSALDNGIRECKKPGWAKEPKEETAKLLASAAKNEFVLDIVGELPRFEKLYDRCQKETLEKKAIATYFKEHYLPTIIKKQAGLFFESGSTIAYLAKELGPQLHDSVTIKGKDVNMRISTNNVLAYLQLWLTAKVPCTLFPWSPPPVAETYGALYGGIESLGERDPVYDLSPLGADARNEMHNLSTNAYGFEFLREKGRLALLLGACSGLQVSKEHLWTFKDKLDPETEKERIDQVQQCYGPHVGSFRNKVFKRFMYETEIPIMIFLTEQKVNCEISIGQCHFMLDNELSWADFCNNYPVAFAVGCSQDGRRKYRSVFEKELGFDVIAKNGAAVTAFIARNKKFIDEFENKLFDFPSKAAPKATP